MNRAYSLVSNMKAVDDVAGGGRRIFSGLATTPEVDRVNDTIDPMGASFKNPLALLRAHDSRCPIGNVTFAKPTPKGIEFEAEIPVIAEPGMLKDRLDMAWGEIKAGLVRAVSIGFKPIKYAFMDDGGIEFQEIEIYELSTVAIPANAGAVISAVKSIDHKLRLAAGVPEPTVPTNPNAPKLPAASGQKQFAVVRLTPPASGTSKQSKTPQEGKMKISEKIARFEEKRAANVARITAIHEGTDESLNEQQLQEVKDLEAEIATIDRDLPSLKSAQEGLARTAKPLGGAVVVDDTTRAAAAAPAAVSIKQAPKLLPGMAYIQLVKVKAASQLTGTPPMVVARAMYGENSEAFGIVSKANEVAPGATVSGNWAVDLISPEGAAVAAFLEYLRPETIVGKFGVNGVPALTKLDFYAPYVTQTGGGAAYWVGEGKPKPLTSFDFDRSTLTPLKIANIAVLTEENIRYSSPNSDGIVRSQLAAAIIAGIDVAFIDPANAGTSNVKPASITNGATAIAAEGTGDADDVRLDIRSLIQLFIAANNLGSAGVLVMSVSNAVGLATMTNALGQPEFPNVTRNGGTILGYPVVVSQHIGNVVAMVAADQIFLGDEGGVQVDMSREASLEMKSVATQDGIAGTGASLVSMFQNNLVALRAERTINWKRARTPAVAYLTGVTWGGAVNAS